MADPDPPATRDEAAPLLGRRCEAQDQEAGASGDSIQTDQQVKTWRRRRWVSLVASMILLVAFVAILILSGAKLSPNYTTIDACTHFDELACGGFYSSEHIPNDRADLSTYGTMAVMDDTIMRHILESPYPRKSKRTASSPARLPAEAMLTDEENFDMMQGVYNTCMDETVLRELGVQPLVHLVQTVADSFPVAECDDDKFGKQDYAALSETILLLKRMGVQTFVSLGTGPDDKNPASPGGLPISPVLDQSEAGVPGPGLQIIIGMIRPVLVEAVTELFSNLHTRGSSRDAAERLAKSVVDLELSLLGAGFSSLQQQDRRKSYHVEKVANAGKLAPPLGLDQPSTVQLLCRLDVGRVPGGPIESFRDFLGYYEDVLSPDVEPITQAYNKILGQDPNTRLERWKICLSHTKIVVPWILSRFYLEAKFSEESKVFAEQISDKYLAINKTHNANVNIGYPTESPEIMSPAALKRWYSNLNVSNSLLDNSVSAKANRVNRTWSALGKPVDRNLWSINSYEDSAYYNDVGNRNFFPAGIMQQPLFHVGWPSYMTYGAFGAVVGHELTHAFDNNGHYFDQHGKYANWWTNHTNEEFSRRAACFVNQYGSFRVKGPSNSHFPVIGAMTMNENIADAGGVATAYAAWKQRQREKVDQSLPGLDFFIHDQLFHVAFAQGNPTPFLFSLLWPR
ncbi:hypothetical protein PG994_001958 [Apiospora phragmitis]|uniref:Uncharacterized protein n=1 Tax=Apiospora phragmitis TaxID=2905665 RepID=A0ABR1WV05_9PEZI